jgi:hypothetical protein
MPRCPEVQFVAINPRSWSRETVADYREYEQDEVSPMVKISCEYGQRAIKKLIFVVDVGGEESRNSMCGVRSI